MPSMDSNSSSSYASSDSSTSSLSSPRVLMTDIIQCPPMRIPTTTHTNLSVSGTHSHGCLTRYKTELCRPFTETGKCKYGDKCQFSHGTNELRILMRHPKYKTEYCRTFHTTGYCPYGPRCHFIHDIHEARTAINPNEQTVRRHSDVRTNSSGRKSTARNRFNSDYVTHSEQSSHSSSKFPWTFEELNRALLSYETGDVFQQEQPQIQIQQQPQQQQQQMQIYPSILPSLTNTLTCRTFSSSSSSNSSLTLQYI